MRTSSGKTWFLALLLAIGIVGCNPGSSGPASPGAPAGLTYTQASAVYTQGVAIAANEPASAGGAVTAYRVAPALPAGLSLDPATGVITGTPAAVTGPVSCAVTASNAAGQTSENLIIAVLAAPSAADLLLPVAVHPGDAWMRASLPAQAGMTDLWTIQAGTGTGALLSGQGTGVLAFGAGTTPGAFQVQVDVQNGAGAQAAAARTVAIQTGTWLVEDGGASVPRTGPTATLLPGGRVLVAGGLDENQAPTATAEIYDPGTGAWVATGALGTARALHTATLLNDGTVLVAGGQDASGAALASVEIYDPATGAWTLGAAPLAAARRAHTATLLGDGTVLVAGGQDSAGNSLASAAIYNPGGGGSWSTATPSLGTARCYHTATLLGDGTVLVAGGGPAYGTLASVEIYNPAAGGSWSAATPGLATARTFHTATRLNDGTVLVAGGQDDSGYSLSSVEIYQPGAGTWTAGPSLGTARDLHTATLLADGTVLITGGANTYGFALAAAEVYSPGAGTWSAATPGLAEARFSHTATLLLDGTVLVAAGTDFNGNVLGGAERFTAGGGGAWNPAVPGLAAARSYHTATRLNDGTVLVAGGLDSFGNTLSSVQIYHPATGAWSPGPSLNTARAGHTATLLGDGSVLVAGGMTTSGWLASVEIYDPAGGGAWSTAAPSMNMARALHTATLLNDGTVLVAGGQNSPTAALAEAEIFDPAGGGSWSAGTPSLGVGRFYHTATLLGDGTVLVAGGCNASYLPIADVEIYSPGASGSWSTSTPSLNPARNFHTATRLNDGTVLLAGGVDASGNALASVTIYNPASGGSWSTATPAMAAARYYHTATLLQDGTVLVAGGDDGHFQPFAAAEIYNPAAGGSWTATGALNAVRSNHSATLLADGTVLAGFGINSSDAVTEIYAPDQGP